MFLRSWFRICCRRTSRSGWQKCMRDMLRICISYLEVQQSISCHTLCLFSFFDCRDDRYIWHRFIPIVILRWQTMKQCVPESSYSTFLCFGLGLVAVAVHLDRIVLIPRAILDLDKRPKSYACLLDRFVSVAQFYPVAKDPLIVGSNLEFGLDLYGWVLAEGQLDCRQQTNQEFQI